MSSTELVVLSGSKDAIVSKEDDPFRISPASSSKKGLRFWFILSALLLSTFLAVLEAYAVSTALPTIVSDLRADQFVWVANAYGIASSALLPFSGGLSESFGRRPVVLGSVALYAAGSALSGAAQSMKMLIAARAVQGAGAGGIYGLTQIILSDLVTLQERGAYNGAFGLIWALGGSLGPLVGGALSRHNTWRWLFYLNVPACGLIATFMVLFLRLSKPSSLTFSEAIARMDVIGNFLVISSTCSIVIGLTWGGVNFSWTSAQVLTPLAIGIAGLAIFLVYEWSYCKYPVVPLYLLSNRTSLSGYMQIALSSIINITLLYFLPVYYQACKNASPTASGVDLFGLCFSSGPVAILAGVSIAVTKRYRPQLWCAWALMIVGLGLTSTITEATSRAASIGFQIPIGVGVGIIFSAVYFPVLAPLPITSNAPAVSFLIYLRTFSQVWGVTVGGAILQNELKRKLPAAVQAAVSGVDNIAYAIVPVIPTLPDALQDEARRAFAESLVPVWRVLIGVAGVGLLMSLPMKGLPLHTTKDENWGMQTEVKDRDA